MTKGKATQQWALGGVYDITCAMLGARYAGVNGRLNPTNCRQHKRAITRIAPTPDQRGRIEEEGNHKGCPYVGPMSHKRKGQW